MSLTSKHQAINRGNSVSVAISPGDIIFVVQTNFTGNTLPTDDGGNQYVLIDSHGGQVGSQDRLFICLGATGAATIITFAPSTTNPTIGVATYSIGTDEVVLLGANNSFGSGGLGGSTIGIALNTIRKHSRVCTMMMWYDNAGVNAISVSATSGTMMVTVPSIVAGPVAGFAIMEQDSTVPSSILNQVASSPVAATRQVVFNIEISYINTVKSGNYKANKPNQGERAYRHTLAQSPIVFTPSHFNLTPIAEDLEGGFIGASYTLTFSSKYGTGPYTYSLVSGTLPIGLSLVSSTGVLSGIPTVAGTYTFTIRATDSLGFTGDQNFQIIIMTPTSGGGSWAFVG